MKKRSIISVFAATALSVSMFISCGVVGDLFNNGVYFTKAEDVKKLNELINPHITSDMLVEKISFDYSASSSSFSYCKDRATVVYFPADDLTKKKGFHIDLKTGEVTPSSFYDNYTVSKFNKSKGVELKDFDFSKIVEVIEAAKKEFEAEKLSADGLGSFEINFSSGSLDKYFYEFKLQNRGDSKQVGRRQQISYKEFSFKADKDGNWVE